MTGSNHFSLEIVPDFERSFRNLAKSYGNQSLKYIEPKNFVTYVQEILAELTENPYFHKTDSVEFAPEPLPSGIQLPPTWTFHKVRFKVGKGSAGLVRLMYLVNSEEQVVMPIWIYNHEQFAKRPPDKELKQVFKAINC